MRTTRTLLVALLFASVFASAPTGATTVTTDQSDLWWNPNESGWGVQMVQRDQAIFATTYVYDSNNVPHWYTALMNYQGNFVWTGDLYQSNGTYFGTVPYNPSAFVNQKAGTMTWNAPMENSGTLTYSVNGMQVTKSLTRFALATDNFGGTYLGAIHVVNSGCFNPALNGPVDAYGQLNVVQSGSSIQLVIVGLSGGTITMVGNLSQAGQFGSVRGQMSASDGVSGSFSLSEMAVGMNGLTARLSSNGSTGCSSVGHMGGIRTY